MQDGRGNSPQRSRGIPHTIPPVTCYGERAPTGKATTVNINTDCQTGGSDPSFSILEMRNFSKASINLEQLTKL